jgi:hypothetical protein
MAVIVARETFQVVKPRQFGIAYMPRYLSCG